MVSVEGALGRRTRHGGGPPVIYLLSSIRIHSDQLFNLSFALELVQKSYSILFYRSERAELVSWAARPEPDAVTAVVDDALAVKLAEHGASAARAARAEQLKFWSWSYASSPDACAEPELGESI